MNVPKLNLTAKQKRYLLFVVDSEKSLADCAKELGITAQSLNDLLARVELKYPGFRVRLNKMRRITLTDENYSMPRQFTRGDFNALDIDADNSFYSFSSSELSNDDCNRPRKAHMFRNNNGKVVKVF